MTDGLDLQLSAADVNAKRVEVFDKWLQTWRYAKNTRLTYVNFVRRFSDFMGAKSFADATTQDVSQFRIALFNHSFSASSQATAFFAVRKLYKFLRMGRLISWSPPHALPSRRRTGKRLPKSLSEKKVKALLAAAESKRDAALLEFSYANGCRPSEICAMRVEDVSLAARTATVRQGKDGDRVVCFGRPAARALAQYLAGRTSGPVFLQAPRRQQGSLLLVRRHRLPLTNGYREAYWRAFWREYIQRPDGTIARVARSVFLGRAKELPSKGSARAALSEFLEKRSQDEEQQRLARLVSGIERPLSTRAIGRIIKKIALRAGLGTNVYPYTLRHSFATHCLHHGMPLRFVQHLLGHEHASTTTVYLHSSPDDLLRVHRRFFPRR